MIGFKSYETSKTVTGNEVWFRWVERSRQQMWLVLFSAKVIQWIVGILTMASKVQGEAIKRWEGVRDAY